MNGAELSNSTIWTGRTTRRLQRAMGGDEKCLHNFGWKAWREEINRRTCGLDVITILK
jgi:hypothetical protein